MSAFIGARAHLPLTKLPRCAAGKSVPYQVVEDALSLVQKLKANGAQIISLDIAVSSVPLLDVPASYKPIYLMLATEDDSVAHMSGHNSWLNSVCGRAKSWRIRLARTGRVTLAVAHSMLGE